MDKRVIFSLLVAWLVVILGVGRAEAPPASGEGPQTAPPATPSTAPKEQKEPSRTSEPAPSRTVEPAPSPHPPVVSPRERARIIKEKLKTGPGTGTVLPVPAPAQPREDRGEIDKRIRTLGRFLRETKGQGAADHVPDQVLVVLSIDDPGVTARLVQELERRHRLKEKRKAELRSITRIMVLFEIPDARPVSQVIGGLVRDPRVQSAQPNFLYRAQAGYNDTHAGLQYGPTRIGVDRVHPYTTGKGVKVALIDTGVDDQHRDLQGKIVERVTVVETDGSFVEDLHGTVLAGIIAARSNNAFGIYGVAPSVDLLAVKACFPESPNSLAAICTSETVARGLDVAILKRVTIINLSLGGPRDALIEMLVKRAVQGGTVIVAAAGNSGPKGPPLYPAALDQVIAVAATDINDELYRFSNIGGYVDLAAPGVDILSTTPGGRFGFFDGTSMAAAHVSGVIALLLQQRPGLTPADLKALIEATAVDLGPPGRDDHFGWGRIDACRAFEKIAGRNNVCR